MRIRSLLATALFGGVLWAGVSLGAPDPVAAACPVPTDVQIVSRVGDAGTPSAKRKFVRSGERVTLYAVVKAKMDGRTYRLGAAPAVRDADTLPAGCRLDLRWYKIEAKAVSYNNAGSIPPEHIEYADTEWTRGEAVAADVHPTLMHDEYPDVPHGLGTMRYRAVATIAADGAGVSVSSVGSECRERGAICRKVHAVVYRPDDTFLGYLHELLNTPYIYGSKRIPGGHQADLQVGSDCADFVVYGKRRERGKKRYGYTYTGGLRKLSRKRWVVRLGEDGLYRDKRGRTLSFGAAGTVRPGDLINFDDGHVGALVRDDGDGVLGWTDLVFHTLVREPEIVPIRDCRWHGISGKEVLRLK